MLIIVFALLYIIAILLEGRLALLKLCYALFCHLMFVPLFFFSHLILPEHLSLWRPIAVRDSTVLCFSFLLAIFYFYVILRSYFSFLLLQIRALRIYL